jgi:hypothetical protein
VQIRPFEILLDRSMDLLSAKGFLLAMVLAWQLVPGGFSMSGIECRTWIWLSRFAIVF